MDDKRFNNDGVVENNGFTESPHTGGYDGFLDEPQRRRFSWVRVALLFIVLGVGLFAVGTLLGARGGYAYFEGGRLRVGTTGRGSAGTTSMTPGAFDRIDINVSSHRVLILPGDSYEVVLPAGRWAPVARVIDDALIVDSRQQGRSGRIHLFGGSIRSTDNEIRVYLPAGHSMDELSVRTSSGRIHIDGVNAGSIYANSSSGRVEVSNLASPVQSMNIRSSSGRVEIANVPAVNDLTLQTSSGRVELNRVGWVNLTTRTSSGRIEIVRGRENIAGGSTVLQTSSGSVNVDIVGDRSSYRYELGTSSGSMRVDGERFSGRDFRGGSGADDISIRTSSGSIRLNFVR